MNEIFPLELLPKPAAELVKICQPATEAPDEFLAAGGLYLGSVLAGPWIEINNRPINNYFLLVGETGTTKKTTAMSYPLVLLERIIKQLVHLEYRKPSESTTARDEYMGPKHPYTLITHFSVEGLQTYGLGQGVSAGIHMGEYGTLFDVGKRQGQQNTISELTNMYDGNPVHVRTLSRQVDVKNYCLCLLAGSTSAWLSDFTSTRNIGGGYVNRHLAFCAKSSRVLARPDTIREGVWDKIASDYASIIPKNLKLVVTVDGPQWEAPILVLDWSILARTAWEQFYRQQTLMMRQCEDSLLCELSARQLTHAVKMAGLRAFMEKRSSINEDDLCFGVRIARWSTQNTAVLVGDIRQPTNLPSVMLRILNKVRDFAPINKTELARHLGGKQGVINAYLELLLAQGHLVKAVTGEFMLGDSTFNLRRILIQEYFGKSDISVVIDKLRVEQPKTIESEERLAIVEESGNV